MNTTILKQLVDSKLRSTADDLTLAYVTKGAFKTLLAAKPYPDLDAFEGEMGFIQEVISQALLVDQVADWFDAVNQHTGVFCYEVAEPFGESYATALLLRTTTVDPKAVLRQTMIDAQYAIEEVDRAIEHACGQREYLFHVTGLDKEFWQKGLSQRDARAQLWNALTDEQRNRVAEIVCIDERSAGRASGELAPNH